MISRRSFLRDITTASSVVALPNLTGLLANPEPTVTFEVKFTGPFAFVFDPKDDHIKVYAPKTQNTHFPAISTDDGEMGLQPKNNYRLDGVSPSKNSTAKINPPLSFPGAAPYAYADSHCRLAISVPRPDLIRGINCAKVRLDNKSVGCKPTGLRFVYFSHPRSSQPVLSSDKPEFTATFQSEDPIWELNIRMVPDTVLDHCHRGACKSFDEVLELCSIKPRPVLSYEGDEVCRVLHGKSLMNHTLKSTEFHGPGSDCQVISVGIQL